MKSLRIARAASPYAVALGTMVLSAMMVTSMSLTAFHHLWSVFLYGVLAAAVFACVSHSANSRWIIARRTAQLKVVRARLATALRLRAHAEEKLARHDKSKRYLDEAMPAMLAYVDSHAIVRYHNLSYARWVGLEESKIDGRSVQELVGRAVYAQIEEPLRNALRGREVRYERSHQMANGEACRLSVQYLPHYGQNGKVAGLFAILTDITRAADLAPVAPEAGNPRAAARLITALERDEFCLYSRSVDWLGHSGLAVPFCEVSLRLTEEEENHLPPGSYLSIAEEHGLLPDLDRWMVRHVLRGVAAGSFEKDAVYVLAVSSSTVAEGAFVEFVRAQLAAGGLDGRILCFEFAEPDVLAKPRVYRDLIAELGWNGCSFVVSGFGNNPASLHFFKQLRVNYLKLDGGIVLNVLRDPVELAKVKAINEAAHEAGMRIVAECVENEDTRAALQQVNTDFAQGLGISLPLPMDRLPAWGVPNASNEPVLVAA